VRSILLPKSHAVGEYPIGKPHTIKQSGTKKEKKGEHYSHAKGAGTSHDESGGIDLLGSPTTGYEGPQSV
jgi:hypothetical protein